MLLRKAVLRKGPFIVSFRDTKRHERETDLCDTLRNLRATSPARDTSGETTHESTSSNMKQRANRGDVRRNMCRVVLTLLGRGNDFLKEKRKKQIKIGGFDARNSQLSHGSGMVYLSSNLKD